MAGVRLGRAHGGGHRPAEHMAVLAVDVVSQCARLAPREPRKRVPPPRLGGGVQHDVVLFRKVRFVNGQLLLWVEEQGGGSGDGGGGGGSGGGGGENENDEVVVCCLLRNLLFEKREA